MSPSTETPPPGLLDDDTLEEFASGVRTVTGGRIRDFAAARDRDRVVLEGEADSFYVRQLVLCLADELPGHPRLVDRMRVATKPR